MSAVFVTINRKARPCILLRDRAPGIASMLGDWIVTKQPDAHLVHFNWLGWIAVAAGLVSILLARRVQVNDTGSVSPLATAATATESQRTEHLVAGP